MSEWLSTDDAPRDGTPIIGSELYRYLPYKKDGARQMRAPGRWQRKTEFGWQNSAAPEAWQPALKSDHIDAQAGGMK
jgi:hypothetical protein